jgi:hypothetical protein
MGWHYIRQALNELFLFIFVLMVAFYLQSSLSQIAQREGGGGG